MENSEKIDFILQLILMSHQNPFRNIIKKEENEVENKAGRRLHLAAADPPIPPTLYNSGGSKVHSSSEPGEVPLETGPYIS